MIILCPGVCRKLLILSFALGAAGCGSSGSSNPAGTVVDTTAPVIILNGTSQVNVELGSTYVDAGATALDNIDGDISGSITPTSTVDTSAVGTYIVTYSVSDVAGNAATPVVRTVNVADTTAPTISSTTPAASANSVARNSVISATFDEDIFAVTVDTFSFTLAWSGDINGTVSFDGATNIATFTPSSDLTALATYTATLSTAITDLSGNALATNYNWSFTTAAEPAELIETDDAAGHDAAYPQIGFDASGNAIAVWFQSDGTITSIWANRYDASTNAWGSPAVIEADDAAGHDAVLPQIGFDASGNAIAVWSQSDSTVISIWANRYDAGTNSWGLPMVIVTDDAAGHDAVFPQIGFDASGNAIAVWHQSDGTVTSIWANRYDAGTNSWGSAAVIEADDAAGHDAVLPQIGLDANGNAIVVWFQSDGTVSSIWANRYDAGTNSWGSAAVIETDDVAGHDAKSSQIGFDASGNAIAVWSQSDGTVFSIWANRYDAGTNSWGSAAVIETDDATGHDAVFPQIGFDTSGNAVAVWSQFDGTVSSIWANRYDVGTNAWGSPVVIVTDTAAGHGAVFPQIGLDASGNAIAVWSQFDGTVFSIWANRYSVGTNAWGSAAVIETDDAAGHDATYPQIGLDASGNAIAVWFQSDGTVFNIWANRFK